MSSPKRLAVAGSENKPDLHHASADGITIDRVLQSVPAVWASLKRKDALRVRASSRGTRSAHDAICSRLCCRAPGKTFNASECRQSFIGIVNRGCRPLFLELRLGGALDEPLGSDLIRICGASAACVTIAFPRRPAPAASGGAAAGGAAPTPLAAAVGPSISPSLRHLVLRCPSAAAVRQSDVILTAAGPRLREIELVVKWPHGLPYRGLSHCTTLVDLRVLCPCPRGGGDSVGRGGDGGGGGGKELPVMQPVGVPPAVAVLSALTQLRSLELRGVGWMPQMGVREPGAQLSSLSALSALTRLSIDLSFVLDNGSADPGPAAAAAAAQPDGSRRATSARVRARLETAAAAAAAGAPAGTCWQRVATWPADEEWAMGAMLQGLGELRELELRGMKVPYENLPAIASLRHLTRLEAGSLSLTPLHDQAPTADSNDPSTTAFTAQRDPRVCSGGGGGEDQRQAAGTGADVKPQEGERQDSGLAADGRPRTPLPPRLKELALDRLPALQLLADLYEHPSSPRLVLLPDSEAAVSRSLWIPVLAGLRSRPSASSSSSSSGLEMPGWMPDAAGAAAALMARDVLRAVCGFGDGASEQEEEEEVEVADDGMAEMGGEEDEAQEEEEGWAERKRQQRELKSMNRAAIVPCLSHRHGGCDSEGEECGDGTSSSGRSLSDSDADADSGRRYVDVRTGADGGGWWRKYEQRRRPWQRRWGRSHGPGRQRQRGGVELTLLGSEEWSGMLHAPHGPWMERLRPLDGYVKCVLLTNMSIEVADLEGLRRGLPSVKAVSPCGDVVFNASGMAALHEEWPVLHGFLQSDSDGWSGFDEEEDHEGDVSDDNGEELEEEDDDDNGGVMINVDDEGNVDFDNGSEDDDKEEAEEEGGRGGLMDDGGGGGGGGGVGIGVFYVNRGGGSSRRSSGGGSGGRVMRLRGMDEDMLADMREDAWAARRAARRAWGSDSEAEEEDVEDDGTDEGGEYDVDADMDDREEEEGAGKEAGCCCTGAGGGDGCGGGSAAAVAATGRSWRIGGDAAGRGATAGSSIADGAGDGGDGGDGEDDLREAAADAEEVEVAEEMRGMAAALAEQSTPSDAAEAEAGDGGGGAAVTVTDAAGDVDFCEGIAYAPISDDAGGDGVDGVYGGEAAAGGGDGDGGGGAARADVDSFFAASSGGSYANLAALRR